MKTGVNSCEIRERPFEISGQLKILIQGSYFCTVSKFREIQFKQEIIGVKGYEIYVHLGYSTCTILKQLTSVTP
jgi:hypothetical protein